MTASVGYLTLHREVDAFEFHHGPAARRAAGYRGNAAHYEPGPEPASGWVEDDRAPRTGPLWMAGNVLTQADDEAAQIAQEARANAAAVREAAEREAVAVREAAERESVAVREAAWREAAELRARLDSILGGEVGQVVARYITESLALPPALPAATPEIPATSQRPVSAPAEPRAEPALPRRTSAVPTTKPGGPGARPADPGARPARPATAPTRAPTKSTAKPVTKAQRQGRQKRAMRIAKYSTAAMLIFALGAAGVEIGTHGYSFFVFRENGQGDSPGGPTDPQFLAQQAAQKAKAAHQAPKGRHHKTSTPANGTTATSTTNG